MLTMVNYQGFEIWNQDYNVKIVTRNLQIRKFFSDTTDRYTNVSSMIVISVTIKLQDRVI